MLLSHKAGDLGYKKVASNDYEQALASTCTSAGAEKAINSPLLVCCAAPTHLSVCSSSFASGISEGSRSTSIEILILTALI